MDEEDFIELKEDTLCIFVEDFPDLVEYHLIQDPDDPDSPNPSSFNNRFGFVDEVDTPDDPDIPTTIITELHFSNHYKALDRFIMKAASDEFIGDYDAAVYIPTLDLENKGISLQRERSFFRFKDGLEYQLEAIQPLPRLYGSSIVHKVLCTKRKPIEDNQGVN